MSVCSSGRSTIGQPVQLPPQWELCGGHVQKGNQLQGNYHRVQRLRHQGGAHQLHGAHRGGAHPAGDGGVEAFLPPPGPLSRAAVPFNASSACALWFRRCCAWGTSTTRTSGTPSTSPSRSTGSSLCGIPRAPGWSAAASARVRLHTQTEAFPSLRFNLKVV